MKKVLSLVLVLTMVLGSFSFAFAAPSDVVGTEYEDAVERLGQLGVLTGYTDGTFKPENTITRAEFAAVVVRAKGLESAAQASAGATTFKDVPAGHWASGYINIATKMGFVKGMGDGTFAPSAPITYEQAITLVTRALGYEPAAESRGGYPYGYLIVANETGLLDSVKGTQGAPASRGLVAQIVDNALEIPLMVQVSYGDRIEHIVSGSRDGVAEKTLLSELNFTKLTGRVTEINGDKNFIRIGDKTLTVSKEFDLQNALGLRLRVWYDTNSNVKLFTALDTPIFDAVDSDEDGVIYLYGEDKEYDLATDKDGKVIATIYLDGKSVKISDIDDFDADYAKVVLDSYGDIIWAEGFTFDGDITVEKVDGNVVESYGYEELSLKGYTIVDKDGKTISIEDLEQNDIVFYNKDNKFAVVANITEEGTIEKVYTDRFVVAGSTYKIAGRYLDAENMNDLSDAVLDSMRKEEKEATVYFDFYGNVVLVVGTRAASTSASNYFLLAAKSESWQDARTKADYFTLDVLNAEGKIVKYDVKQTEIGDHVTSPTVKFTTPSKANGNASDWTTALGQNNSVNTILKLTINTSDKVTAVEVVENHRITNVDNTTAPNVTNVKTTASYIAGYKLQDNTVIFRKDGAAVKDYSVTTWAKAEEDFTVIKTGQYYVGANGRVVAIFAETTDAPDDNVTYYGLLKDVKILRNGLKEVTILSEGKEYTFETEADDIAGFNDLVKLNMVKITVVDKTQEIKTAQKLNPAVDGGKIAKLQPGAKTITIGTTVYELVDNAVIYKDGTTSTLRFADLKVDEYVDIYLREGSGRFAIYVVKVDGPGTGGNNEIDLTVASNRGSATVVNAVYNTNYVLKVTNVDTNDVVYATGTADVDGDVSFNFAPTLIGNAVYKFELFKDSPVAANHVRTWADKFLAQGGPQEPVVNKTALNSKISEAQLLNEEDYTEETWEPFATALANAIVVAAKINATQGEVNNALTTLTAAMGALIEKPEEPVVDKTALSTKIAEADELESEDYTEETWGPFATALTNAKAIAAKEDATQEEVNNALSSLTAAMGALVEKPVVSKTALNEKIAEAQLLNEEDYTEETWAALEAVLESAMQVVADENATQEAVDTALNELAAAIQGLEEKPEEINYTVVQIQADAVKDIGGANGLLGYTVIFNKNNILDKFPTATDDTVFEIMVEGNLYEIAIYTDGQTYRITVGSGGIFVSDNGRARDIIGSAIVTVKLPR